MLGRGRVPFYVQQGAGIWLITRPLAQLRNAPASSCYMEVGCGFGFGLDYAIRTKGWDGRGIDPPASPRSAATSSRCRSSCATCTTTTRRAAAWTWCSARK